METIEKLLRWVEKPVDWMLWIALLAAVSAALNAYGLPAGLRGAPLSLASWTSIGRNRQVVLLLIITALLLAGNFQVFVYFGPLLAKLAGAGPQTIALAFAGTGIIAVIGNVITTRVVGRIGPFRVSLVLFAGMLLGLLIWSAGTGWLAVMLLGAALIGVGTAAANSMQQARLAAAAPELAGASIALNTSAIYVGQAIGSAAGGVLIVRDMAPAVGYVAAAFMAAALLVLFLTRDESRKS